MDASFKFHRGIYFIRFADVLLLLPVLVHFRDFDVLRALPHIQGGVLNAIFLRDFDVVTVVIGETQNSIAYSSSLKSHILRRSRRPQKRLVESS